MSSTTTVPFTIDSIAPGMLAFPDSPDLYRIRIRPEHAAGGPTIKYLAAPNSSKTITGPDAHVRRLANLAFDTVPSGNWVVAHLTPTSDDGKLTLTSTSSDPPSAALAALGLESASPVWHPTTIDLADLTLPFQESPPNPHLHLQTLDHPTATLIPTPPGLVAATTTTTTTTTPNDSVVVLVAEWLPGHHHAIEQASRAHQLIAARDPGLAPRFLGHVTENGERVVGFLLEAFSPDAVREAAVGDLEACKEALRRLHELGVGLQRVERHSFLVRADGSGGVVVQGPFAFAAEDGGARKEEVESLEGVLGKSPSVFEERAERVGRLADPERAERLAEFEKAHGVVVPFVHWQETKEGGGRITLTVEEHGVLAKEWEENGFRWTEELQDRAEKRFGLSAKGA